MPPRPPSGSRPPSTPPRPLLLLFSQRYVVPISTFVCLYLTALVAVYEKHTDLLVVFSVNCDSLNDQLAHGGCFVIARSMGLEHRAYALGGPIFHVFHAYKTLLVHPPERLNSSHPILSFSHPPPLLTAVSPSSVSTPSSFLRSMFLMFLIPRSSALNLNTQLHG